MTAQGLIDFNQIYIPYQGIFSIGNNADVLENRANADKVV